jgi:hypothetical protein
MRFNAETKISDLQGMHKVAYYWSEHEYTCILDHNSEHIVASFNRDGYCTNASSYRDKRRAWKLFIEIIQPDVEG